jgi:hypothetical protein
LAQLYEQLLLFPKRAEYLRQDLFKNYRVRFEHWKGLSASFLEAFKAVYERQDAAVLLVHGAQGSGKTLFSHQLEKGFKQTWDQGRSGQPITPQSDNLWHTLVADQFDPDIIQKATAHTGLHRVEPVSKWLETERSFAKTDKSRVRIFVIDDVHRDHFIREWADLSSGEYIHLRANDKLDAALNSVAQQLVQDCRGDFSRSIFLLLSNNEKMMTQLKEHLDEFHLGLATLHKLPLPPPELKEEIVRTNTNRFNRISYWACLDRGGPKEKKSVYEVLMGEGGFTDSFDALSRTLHSEEANKRTGRPANKNILTVVTLGTDPDAAWAFIQDQGLASAEGLFTHCRGKHVGVWLMPSSWASILDSGRDANLTRRASMLESEFALRWVTLDMRATHALLADPTARDLGERLVEIIRFFPSIAKPEGIEEHKQSSLEVDESLEASPSAPEELAAFEKHLRELGQRRSTEYEQALRKRLTHYGLGFKVYPAVRPDLIEEEYASCAITRASTDTAPAIREAISRSCHAIEFTTHLQPDMNGLVEYVLKKVDRYSEMLESV